MKLLFSLSRCVYLGAYFAAIGFGAQLPVNPLPYSYLGQNNSVVAPVSPRIIRIDTHDKNVGGGGQFIGRVSLSGSIDANQTINDADNVATKFWCVDSQLVFAIGNQGNANIISLSSLPHANTRYGTDGNPGFGEIDWTNDDINGSSPGGVLPDTSQDRFRMAAYLITKYTFFPGSTTSNSSQNINIQGAIWAIMHNNFPAPGTADLTDATYYQITTAERTWIEDALEHYESIDTTKWAVVSWLVEGNGTLVGDSGDRQTFLVQVVPEPGFYGMLCVGLGSLLWVFRRRDA